MLAVAAGAPGAPHVDGITPNSVTLSWAKPTDTGGGKIQGYQVEVKPKNGDWAPAMAFPVKENECTVPNLKEGQEYEFRVKAINEAGPGNPSMSTGPVVAEKPPGWTAVLRASLSYRQFHSLLLVVLTFRHYSVNIKFKNTNLRDFVNTSTDKLCTRYKKCRVTAYVGGCLG